MGPCRPARTSGRQRTSSTGSERAPAQLSPGSWTSQHTALELAPSPSSSSAPLHFGSGGAATSATPLRRNDSSFASLQPLSPLGTSPTTRQLQPIPLGCTPWERRSAAASSTSSGEAQLGGAITPNSYSYDDDVRALPDRTHSLPHLPSLSLCPLPAPTSSDAPSAIRSRQLAIAASSSSGSSSSSRSSSRSDRLFASFSQPSSRCSSPTSSRDLSLGELKPSFSTTNDQLRRRRTLSSSSSCAAASGCCSEQLSGSGSCRSDSPELFLQMRPRTPPPEYAAAHEPAFAPPTPAQAPDARPRHFDEHGLRDHAGRQRQQSSSSSFAFTGAAGHDEDGAAEPASSHRRGDVNALGMHFGASASTPNLLTRSPFGSSTALSSAGGAGGGFTPAWSQEQQAGAGASSSIASRPSHPGIQRRTTAQSLNQDKIVPRHSPSEGSSQLPGTSSPYNQREAPLPRPGPRLRDSPFWSFVFFILQGLSVIPALVGFLYAVHRFLTTSSAVSGEGAFLMHAGTSTWDARGTATGISRGRSTRLDWLVAAIWALTCAYFTYSLTRGLLRRWIVYYTFVPSAIRVISLQAMCWTLTFATHRFLTLDQPVAAWIACATTAAISNVVQIWVTSNIASIERRELRRNSRRWKALTAVVGAVLGPSVSADKFRKAEGRALSWRRVLWSTVLPFAVIGWFTTTTLLWQQYMARYSGAGGLDAGGFHGSVLVPSTRSTSAFAAGARSEVSDVAGLDRSANVRVVVLVASSWSEHSARLRDAFRSSSARLAPRRSRAVAITHRFILGSPPSPQAQTRRAVELERENAEYGDLVFVPAPDRVQPVVGRGGEFAHDASAKAWHAWRWAAGLEEVDYVVKTSENVFVRMDKIAAELAALGRRLDYWRGFAFWSMRADGTNAGDALELATYPPYTSSALHILSHNLAKVVAPESISSRLMLRDEDQSLGLWLYATGVRPVHDYRVQHAADVCEDDMVAKRFSSDRPAAAAAGMADMYENVAAGHSQCSGVTSKHRALCHPSSGRHPDFVCDSIRGATHRHDDLGEPAQVAPVKAPSQEPALMGTADDPWILPGILSRRAAEVSMGDNWHLLHMMPWTLPASAFGERHLRALESVLAHRPRAIVVVPSTTLPLDFFKEYIDHGYAVHVVRVSKDAAIENEWYLGPESRAWLERWDTHERGPHFASHLREYLRFTFLHKYGGQCHDFDRPLLRAPPSDDLEFIGSDYSTMPADHAWTLDHDGLYLQTGIMRFKQGWTLFRDVLEHAFSTVQYDPACVDCVGSRALTAQVRRDRSRLQASGLSILPHEKLSPSEWVTAPELFASRPGEEAGVEFDRISTSSWALNLFGKTTDRLEIMHDSVVARALDTFALGVSHPVLISQPSAFELRAPKMYHYKARNVDELEDQRASLNGRFEGADLLFVRGSSNAHAPATIKIATTAGGRFTFAPASQAHGLAGSTRSDPGVPATSTDIQLTLGTDATLRDINAFLVDLLYIPCAGIKQDSLDITIVHGTNTVSRTVAITL